MVRAILSALAICAAGQAAADEAVEAFVESNLLGIFYHELGHALIDTEALPVFGQEEDAADVFSILLVDALFEEQSAQDLAYGIADGFWGEALVRDANRNAVAWWDVHGPDEQRFYNTVCLFYGANPDARARFSADMELPQDRAGYCPEELDMAYASWGPVLDSMMVRDSAARLRFRADADNLTAQLVEAEVDALNATFGFAQSIDVLVEPCGQANAFYDPNSHEIIMCSEFEDHLRVLAEYLK